MFHLVFSGPEQAAGALTDKISDLGYPAQPCTDRSGLPAEHLTGWVEAIAHDDDVDALARLCELAAASGYQLRLHGPVTAPQVGRIGLVH